jgi:hypothetical protein
MIKHRPSLAADRAVLESAATGTNLPRMRQSKAAGVTRGGNGLSPYSCAVAPPLSALGDEDPATDSMESGRRIH